MQLLNRIELIHTMHFLHRDIKPENLFIGNESKTNIIFLIDFGLSKRFKNKKLFSIFHIKKVALLLAPLNMQV